MKDWKNYQPKREREKAFYDIQLRDGTVVECCWPNDDAWTCMRGPDSGKAFKDYRVVAIRKASHPMDDLADSEPPPFKPGDRVRVCPNPKCGHHGGVTGTVDLVGYFVDTMMLSKDDKCATVLRDGGGVVGPFRLDELTRL